MWRPPAPVNADHGGGRRGRVGAGLGETDAEANHDHESASPNKPATAAERRADAGTPGRSASPATTAAAATLTLDALRGTAVLPGTRRASVQGNGMACQLRSLPPRSAYHRNPANDGRLWE
jgi:hypothetical protein